MERRVPPTNLVVMGGKLVTDPQRRHSDGTSCTEFLMANNRPFRTTTGERREKSCFVSVITWGVLADDCLNYLSRKSAVCVEGELESATQAQGGKISIRATKVEFLDKGSVEGVSYADRHSTKR